jgi:hypothetical protein
VGRLRLPLAVAAALFRRDARCACRAAPAATSNHPARTRTVAVTFVCSGPRRGPGAATSPYGGPSPA